LFSTIITSSIWSEDDQTRIIWITLLALANRYGEIAATIPGISRAANIPIPQVETALKKFQEPDKYSRSKDYEGRRIKEIPGGWQLLNYAFYRQKTVKNADYYRDWRAGKAQPSATKCNQSATKRNQEGVVAQPNICALQPPSDIQKQITDTDTYKLTQLLLELIRCRKPDFRSPNIAEWCVQVDRMIRIDNRTPERIAEVIKWCQADTGDGSNGKWKGWQNNILSTAKLREKFDILELRMQEQKNGQRAGNFSTNQSQAGGSQGQAKVAGINEQDYGAGGVKVHRV